LKVTLLYENSISENSGQDFVVNFLLDQDGLFQIEIGLVADSFTHIACQIDILRAQKLTNFCLSSLAFSAEIILNRIQVLLTDKKRSTCLKCAYFIT